MGECQGLGAVFHQGAVSELQRQHRSRQVLHPVKCYGALLKVRLVLLGPTFTARSRLPRSKRQRLPSQEPGPLQPQKLATPDTTGAAPGLPVQARGVDTSGARSLDGTTMEKPPGCARQPVFAHGQGDVSGYLKTGHLDFCWMFFMNNN